MWSLATSVPVKNGKTGEFDSVGSFKVNCGDIFHILSPALIRFSTDSQIPACCRRHNSLFFLFFLFFLFLPLDSHSLGEKEKEEKTLVCTTLKYDAWLASYSSSKTQTRAPPEPSSHTPTLSWCASVGNWFQLKMKCGRVSIDLATSFLVCDTYTTNFALFLNAKHRMTLTLTLCVSYLPRFGAFLRIFTFYEHQNLNIISH